MKTILTLLLTILVQLAFSQDPPVLVQFERAEFVLYKGYVNRAQVNFLFVNGKHPRYKFQAIARGATIEYIETGAIAILPTEPEVRLRVYVETKDKVFWAGDIMFKCIPPPDNATVKELGLTRKLNMPINYVLAGKDVEKTTDIIPEIVSTRVVDLTEGVEIKMNTIVLQKYDEYYRRLLEDYGLTSDDAEVKKVSRLVFAVKPNPGVKSCKLVLSLGGDKVSQVTLPVVPK